MLDARRSGVCVLVALALVLTAGAALASQSKGGSWTVIVYLDADNNLDPDAYVDIAEMEAVGSTASVNVVVLWDKLDGPANVVQVFPGRVEVVKGFSLNGKEVNMGSGDTLEAFVDFAVAKFPANRVLLDLWDHGDDFRGFAWDDHPTADGLPGTDYMTHDEIVDALAGHHLDVLAFDGCVMSNLEVAYEYAVRDLAIDYLVASEIYIPNQGFAYDGLLGAVAANPAMDGLAFAEAIVDSYATYYGGGGWQVGLSVVTLAEMPQVVAALAGLTDVLVDGMAEYRDCIGTGRGEAMLGWSMYGWEAFVDFPTWLRGLAACVGHDAVLEPLVADVDAALADAVVYVWNSHALDVKGAGGIGVYFPGAKGSFEHNVYWRGSLYLGLQFAHEGWFAFLLSYWDAG